MGRTPFGGDATGYPASVANTQVALRMATLFQWVGITSAYGWGHGGLLVGQGPFPDRQR
jgi:hypothetical protein